MLLVYFSIVFADDPNMFLSGKNPDDLIKSDECREITKFVYWLRIYKLSLNLKTKQKSQCSEKQQQQQHRKVPE